VTYGYSSTDQKKSYVERFARSISKTKKVNVYLHAKPGWTSTKLLKSMESLQSSIFEEAGIVTLMVGGNDLLRSSPFLLNGNHAHLLKVADRYYQNLVEIVCLAKRPHSRFMIATLYNPFPNSMMASEYTRLVNDCVRRVARRYNLHLVDLAARFQGKESRFVEGYRRGTIKDFRIIGNPVHPNDTGHAAIARAFLETHQRTRPKQITTRGKMKRVTNRGKMKRAAN
jgi:lysophospholipase L1-like esterase